ncbi:Do family serine endopeptidase [Sinimarinibacterium sp. NLF-5-8]|uniref:Do family serine endopeptidase n=1 Tax=Sinimarinibacterium sp. NLF-5-8 TaxID=2698684 RepID=UPI00137B9CEA|nr:Do family serine endopeptidase [Sinimarinibacterium sp. NLF-5-8]QHS09832.1 Do family serine endopeptidase [Sinimarinibacterium sp. NLF-5-8]
MLSLIRFPLAVLALLALLGCQRSATPQAAAYPDFADLVERVSPAVVNISTVAAQETLEVGGAWAPQAQLQDSAQAEGEDVPDWFRRYIEPQDGAAESDDGDQWAAPDQQSLGSGFILSSDGDILTNYHVIRGAREIVVRLLDRRQFAARVIGSDEASDLALLHIDARNLPVVRLGDARATRPGQWVLAIGSPFGFDYSVTAGIVSAKGRALASEQYVPFIQSDVAINPGNSGGPLFNLAGEVIGVNSQIYSQSGGYQGVSFSTPIDVAAKVARQLRETGRVTRGWLGVVVQEVDREQAQAAGLDKSGGAMVARVLTGSPAAQAGLREGDIIVRYNGEFLPSSSSLPHLVGIADPGEMARLELRRDGRSVMVEVEVGTLRSERSAHAAAPADADPGSAAQPASLAQRLQMQLRPLQTEEARAQRLMEGGLMVIGVGDGPAARAGIRAGDVLLQLAGQQISSLDRYHEVLARLLPGQTVSVLVQRRGAPHFLSLDVPEPTPPED